MLITYVYYFVNSCYLLITKCHISRIFVLVQTDQVTYQRYSEMFYKEFLLNELLLNNRYLLVNDFLSVSVNFC